MPDACKFENVFECRALLPNGFGNATRKTEETQNTGKTKRTKTTKKTRTNEQTRKTKKPKKNKDHRICPLPPHTHAPSAPPHRLSCHICPQECQGQGPHKALDLIVKAFAREQTAFHMKSHMKLWIPTWNATTNHISDNIVQNRPKSYKIKQFQNSKPNNDANSTFSANN